MSYEIIKSVTFYEKDKRIVVRSSSNNVTPKYYDAWEPTACGFDYEQWKRMFCASCFGGMSQFQPSCKSKAKKAYDAVNRRFGLHDTARGVWHEAMRRYPYELGWNKETRRYDIDQELKAAYDAFEEEWVQAFIDELNSML